MNNNNNNNTLSSSDDNDSVAPAPAPAPAVEQGAERNQFVPMDPRHWRDVNWIGYFIFHLVMVSCFLGVLGINRFRIKDRQRGLTEEYWPLYAITGTFGTIIAWTWLLLLSSLSHWMMKMSSHVLPFYLAILSGLCFGGKHLVWGAALAICAGLLFVYIISINERLPFTMLVLQRGVKMVLMLPEVMRLACVFMLVSLMWLALWTFGASGVVASGIGDGLRWWLLVFLSVSLLWTGAVLCNIVHVIGSKMVFLVLIHGGREEATTPLLDSLRYALTTSLGSICYGSLVTAPIGTLRWAIRGFRSKIGNKCLLCCVDFVVHVVEILFRFHNKYAYFQIAVYGKGFNNSARDAWELFQSTGVEELIANDYSGVVLLLGTFVGGLTTGTVAVFLTRIKHPDADMMMGYTALLIGLILVSLAMVVVESVVSALYVCYAENPLLIQRWDPEFFNLLSETLHRLQHRSTNEGVVGPVSV